MKLNNNECTFNFNDMKQSFSAGINRGCFVASLITSKNPIDAFPNFEEYMEQQFGLIMVDPVKECNEIKK